MIGHVENFATRTPSNCCIPSNQTGSYVCFDLKGHKLRPKCYTIRDSTGESRQLRNWVLEGSNDNLKWDIIREHKNDPKLTSGMCSSWSLETHMAYGYLRIRVTGKDSTGISFYLCCSGIEFYGTLETIIDLNSFPIERFKNAMPMDLNKNIRFLRHQLKVLREPDNPDYDLLPNQIVALVLVGALSSVLLCIGPSGHL